MDYYGKIGPEYSARAFHLILEAFGSIKEIKLAGNEKTYLDLFEPTAKRWADAEVKKIFFMITPAGIVEVFAFGGIILVSMLMIVSAEGLQEIVPLLGIYALSLRRIIPAIQNIYLQISEIKYYKPSFDKIYPDLVSSLTLDKKNSNSLDNKSGNIFFKKIEIINLSFSYPESPKKIINSVSTNIDAGSIIGIAGESGAGKTTFIDLVLGVFEACDGSILLDGRPTRGELLRGWQKNIGYVPQLGFISDSSIAKNIAFGIPEEEIDIDRVKKVSAIAQISEFIESELPMQYETLVGEGGSSLSGGQRQRIRIARALYNNPNVLIFDEATSALDGIVEERILESIRNFGGGKTIFLISHRLSTLKECDKILFFEKGELIDEGTFEHLISNNSSFKIMAKESENHSSF